MKKIIHHTKKIAHETLHELRQRPHRHKQRIAVATSAGITGVIFLVWLLAVGHSLPDFSKSAASLDVFNQELLGASAITAYDEFGNPVSTKVDSDGNAAAPLESSLEYDANGNPIEQKPDEYQKQKEVTTVSGEKAIVPASDGSVELTDKNKKD